MDPEKGQGQIVREEQVRSDLESGLPAGLNGLIMEVKLVTNKEGKEETIVTACSWHNSKPILGQLTESLPEGVSLSHGMCAPCTNKQNALLDQMEI